MTVVKNAWRMLTKDAFTSAKENMGTLSWMNSETLKKVLPLPMFSNM